MIGEYQHQIKNNYGLIRMGSITTYVLFSVLVLLTVALLVKSAMKKVYGLTYGLVALLLIDSMVFIAETACYHRLIVMVKDLAY